MRRANASEKMPGRELRLSLRFIFTKGRIILCRIDLRDDASILIAAKRQHRRSRRYRRQEYPDINKIESLVEIIIGHVIRCHKWDVKKYTCN